VKSLGTLQPLALLILRMALGIIFLYHGYPKLAHSGADLQTAFVEHGLPAYFVYVAGILETFGGGLLLGGTVYPMGGVVVGTRDVRGDLEISQPQLLCGA
jgi:putative oxidoreductase